MDFEKVVLPVKRAFGRFSFKQKFIIVTLAFVIPFILPSIITFKHFFDELSIVKKERASLEFIPLIKDLILKMQKHRGLEQGWLAGEKSFESQKNRIEKEIDRKLEQIEKISRQKSIAIEEKLNEIKAIWSGIKRVSLNAQESFLYHSFIIEQLLELQKQIALQFGIYNDNNIQNHYLIVANFETVPTLTEYLAQIRGIATRILATKNGKNEEEKRQIQKTLILLHPQLKNLSDEIVNYGAHKNSAQKVLKEFLRLRTDIEKFIDDAKNILTGKGKDTKSFFQYATNVIDESKQFYNLLLEQFRYDLEQREWMLTLQITGLFLGLLLISFMAAALFFGFFYSIYTPLQKFQEAIKKISQGDYDVKVEVETQDELKALADTFNKLIHDLQKHINYLNSYKIALNQATLVTRSDKDGYITYANEAFLKATGYSLEEILGKPHSIFRHPEMPKETFEKLWQRILSKKIWKGRLKIRDKNGKTLIMQTAIVPLVDGKGEIQEFMAVRVDVTELIEAQEKIKKMLYYDTLTSLPNRVKLLYDCKTREVRAIILINIEDFRVVNDIYGYEGGNFVLQKCAKLLKNFENRDLKVYRFPSDEFALVFFKPITLDQLDTFAYRVIEDLEKHTFIYNGYELKILVRAGSALLDHRKNSMEEVLLDAETAIKEAKSQIRKIVHFSESESAKKSYLEQLEWIKKIKEAIKEDRIEPYFQPIYNNRTKRVEKYEALMRLIDEDGKVISPFFFLDVAKKSKLYTQISKIMIEKSLNYFQDRPEDLSLNVTVLDIEDEETRKSILYKIQEFSHEKRRKGIKEKSAVDGCVVIELTESEEIENYELIAHFNKIIKKMGYKIAIDDFGTGYSNFVYILNMGFDYLKIDGSLIKNILKDERSLTLVKAIVDFSHELGLKTVAEFVSDAQIQQKVEEIGVDYSQGYFISEPMPIEKVREFKPHF